MNEQQDAAPPDVSTAEGLLYLAWTVIANAGEGDWSRESEEWQKAAVRWRDDFHAYIDANRERFR